MNNQCPIDTHIRRLVDEKDRTLQGAVGKKKAKDFAEVTTSVDLIDKQLDLLPKEVFLDLSKTVLDPCTGDGRYLMRYLYRRLPNIHTTQDVVVAVSTLYGIELQIDNVKRAVQNIISLVVRICEVKQIICPPLVPLTMLVRSNIKQGSFI